tara:strand:+ start:470 stop:727 length:258 start_codon:yes stop_codon:yes gene_type:complete
MPTYSYECQACGNIMDVFQKMADSTLKKYDCNKCNKKNKVKRIIKGGSGMIFKGSGFYLTDYTDYGKSPKSSKKKLKENKNNNKD